MIRAVTLSFVLLLTSTCQAADHFFFFPQLGWYPTPLVAPQTGDELSEESVSFRCHIVQHGGGGVWEIDGVSAMSNSGEAWNGYYTGWLQGFDPAKPYSVAWQWTETVHDGTTNPYASYTTYGFSFQLHNAGTKYPFNSIYPIVDGPF